MSTAPIRKNSSYLDIILHPTNNPDVRPCCPKPNYFTVDKGNKGKDPAGSGDISYADILSKMKKNPPSSSNSDCQPPLSHKRSLPGGAPKVTSKKPKTDKIDKTSALATVDNYSQFVKCLIATAGCANYLRNMMLILFGAGVALSQIQIEPTHQLDLLFFGTCESKVGKIQRFKQNLKQKFCPNLVKITDNSAAYYCCDVNLAVFLILSLITHRKCNSTLDPENIKNKEDIRKIIGDIKSGMGLIPCIENKLIDCSRYMKNSTIIGFVDPLSESVIDGVWNNMHLLKSFSKTEMSVKEIIEKSLVPSFGSVIETKANLV